MAVNEWSASSFANADDVKSSLIIAIGVIGIVLGIRWRWKAWYSFNPSMKFVVGRSLYSLVVRLAICTFATQVWAHSQGQLVWFLVNTLWG